MNDLTLEIPEETTKETKQEKEANNGQGSILPPATVENPSEVEQLKAEVEQLRKEKIELEKRKTGKIPTMQDVKFKAYKNKTEPDKLGVIGFTGIRTQFPISAYSYEWKLILSKLPEFLKVLCREDTMNKTHYKTPEHKKLDIEITKYLKEKYSF